MSEAVRLCAGLGFSETDGRYENGCERVSMRKLIAPDAIPG